MDSVVGLYGWCSCKGNQPHPHDSQNSRAPAADNQNGP